VLRINRAAQHAQESVGVMGAAMERMLGVPHGQGIRSRAARGRPCTGTRPGRRGRPGFQVGAARSPASSRPRACQSGTLERSRAVGLARAQRRWRLCRCPSATQRAAACITVSTLRWFTLRQIGQILDIQAGGQPPVPTRRPAHRPTTRRGGAADRRTAQDPGASARACPAHQRGRLRRLHRPLRGHHRTPYTEAHPR
jgi:hypothetical protein